MINPDLSLNFTHFNKFYFLFLNSNQLIHDEYIKRPSVQIKV